MILAAALAAATGVARAELLAWWPLDSAASAPGRDAAPAGRHRLQFVGGAGEMGEGRLPGSLAWSTAGGDFALIEEFPATAAFSFVVWVKREAVGGEKADELATIVRLGERNQAGWALYVAPSGNWTAYAYGAQARKLDAKVAAKPGEWTHVALTFAPASAGSGAGESVGVLSLYVNGRLANKGEFGVARDGATAPLALGARHYNGNASWLFPGQISQAAVWDEALPSTLIAELARGRAPGDSAP